MSSIARNTKGWSTSLGSERATPANWISSSDSFAGRLNLRYALDSCTALTSLRLRSEMEIVSPMPASLDGLKLIHSLLAPHLSLLRNTFYAFGFLAPHRNPRLLDLDFSVASFFCLYHIFIHIFTTPPSWYIPPPHLA